MSSAKRSASSKTPSPSKAKRQKVDPDQTSLKSFFGPKPNPSPSPKKEDAQTSIFDKGNADLRSEVGPVVRESKGKQKARATSVEIIDVDEDDDIAPLPSPSKMALSFGKMNQAASNAPDTYPILSTDPLTFSLTSCPWSCKAAPYSFLTHALVTLSETRSRILILNTLTNTLRIISRYHPPSLLPSLYLLSNSLAPPYSPVELGIGSSVLTKALQAVSGLTPAALRHLYNMYGDPGDLAFHAKSSVRTLIPHPPLEIKQVFNAMLRISQAKGAGAGKQKQSIVEKLLVAANGEESRYLVRMLSQNLRVGAVRTTILSALARGFALTPPTALNLDIPDSEYHVSSEMLEKVQPPPEAEGKKKKTVSDPARAQVNERVALAEALVKKVFVQHPNYDDIVSGMLSGGLDGLAERVPLTVGIPLHPTLGSPTRSLDEIYERLGDLPFSAEFKYDGQRAQIHVLQGQNNDGVMVKIFSRHLEDMTDKYPDVIALMKTIFTSSTLMSCIIDAEITAIDSISGALRSFQELSNRARKDVQIHDVKIAVCVYAFDLMYLNGKALLQEPFRRRRSLLRQWFPPVTPDVPTAARFAHVESCESEDGREAVEEFWERAVEGKCEGLMIKLLDSGEVIEEASSAGKIKTRRKPLPATYEPDKRTSAWLKLKKDYIAGLGDSLDLVPIGAYYGQGRKAAWWSPILLGLWDENLGKFVGVCKCMSGFSDAFYKALSDRYQVGSDFCSKVPLWDCETGGLKPDVYFKPSEVWEIRGADVTLSPVSVAALGLVSSTRGLSLRFPRFIKIRDDKNIEDASGPEFLAGLWKIQEERGKTSAPAVDDGELIDVEWEESSHEDDEEEKEE